MTENTERLLAADRTHVHNLRSHFNNYDPSDREGFRVILKIAFQHGVSRDGLCVNFGVSPGTVSRWESGETAPAEIARGIIVSRLSKMVVPLEARLVSKLS